MIQKLKKEIPIEVAKLEDFGHRIRETLMRETGLPVGVGIARTKVLAKLANKMAKKRPDNAQVCVLDTEDKRIKALQTCAIGKVWGIGKQHQGRLEHIGVSTALDFTQLPLAWVRREMTVVGERIWRELRNETAMEFTLEPKKKKGIGTAKSFGKKLVDIGLIEEACAYYVTEVTEVLRSQQSLATSLNVFLTTNYHSDYDRQYSNSVTIELPLPTNNTFELIAEAKKGLHQIFKPGFRYKKVGVNLLGIVPEDYIQGNLFHEKGSDKNKINASIDFLNQRFGKAKVGSGMLGKRMKQWELIKEERSPRFTTQWSEILKIKV